MNNLNINPFVRCAYEYERMVKESDIQFAYDCRIFYIQKGRGSLTTGGKTYSLVPYTVYYVPMGERYLFEAEEDMLIYAVNFDLNHNFSHITHPLGSSIAEPEEEVPHYELPEEFSKTFYCDAASRIYENIKICMYEFITRGIYYGDAASAALKQGLINILREYAVKSNADHKIADKALNYARRNIRNPFLSNVEIADYVGYHPYYVSSLVKEATGMNLRQYITYTRLKMAKSMLSTTSQEIATLSKKCGFHNVTYFNRVFKSSFGVTPKEYRKTHYLL